MTLLKATLWIVVVAAIAFAIIEGIAYWATRPNTAVIATNPSGYAVSQFQPPGAFEAGFSIQCQVNAPPTYAVTGKPNNVVRANITFGQAVSKAFTSTSGLQCKQKLVARLRRGGLLAGFGPQKDYSTQCAGRSWNRDVSV
jgi:hypothetical protein